MINYILCFKTVTISATLLFFRGPLLSSYPILSCSILFSPVPLSQPLTMSLTNILLAAQSSDANIRVPAEQQLQSALNTNFPMYLGSLCQELADDSKPQDSRQIAGLALKNTLVARSETQIRIVTDRW
jgi:hypothetical protein